MGKEVNTLEGIEKESKSAFKRMILMGSLYLVFHFAFYFTEDIRFLTVLIIIAAGFVGESVNKRYWDLKKHILFGDKK